MDFRKAYDFIDRNILWKKLYDIGINGNMYKTLQSLYHTVSSCVRLNGLKTDWFDVHCYLCFLTYLLMIW
jgi:hypothetical protein